MVLPSGEMELAGQVARTISAGVELLKPSNVRLAPRIAACVVLVSLVEMRTEKSIESVVTCSSARRSLGTTTAAEGGANPSRGSVMENPVVGVANRKHTLQTK
jgi:hypothetical protein